LRRQRDASRPGTARASIDAPNTTAAQSVRSAPLAATTHGEPAS